MAVVGLYVAIAAWVIAKSPGWWRLAALVLALLIPSADAIFAHHFVMPGVCRDAGVRFLKVADASGGLRKSSADKDDLRALGLAFVEGIEGTTRIYRWSLKDGVPVLEMDVPSRARYIAQRELLSPAYKVIGERHYIFDATNNDLIAERINFSYVGGWAERFLASFTGSGAGPMVPITCNPVPFDYSDFIRRAFGRN